MATAVPFKKDTVPITFMMTVLYLIYSGSLIYKVVIVVQHLFEYCTEVQVGHLFIILLIQNALSDNKLLTFKCL